MARDFESPEQMWASKEPNDLGYECPKCGHVPSFRELKNGTCPGCRAARKVAETPPAPAPKAPEPEEAKEATDDEFHDFMTQQFFQDGD